MKTSNKDENSEEMEVDNDPELTISEEEWDELQQRGDFLPEHLGEARTIIERAIQEFVYHRNKPAEILLKKKVLRKLMKKIDVLGEELHDLSLDSDIYELLVDDNSPEIPTAFVDGTKHAGHQDLVNLLGNLRIMADRIDSVVADIPKTKRGPQNKNLVRLMLRIFQLISRCTNRNELSNKKKMIIKNKYSSNEIAVQICKLLGTRTKKKIKVELIQAAIEDSNRLLNGNPNLLQAALGPHSIYNMLIGDSLKDYDGFPSDVSIVDQ